MCTSSNSDTIRPAVGVRLRRAVGMRLLCLRRDSREEGPVDGGGGAGLRLRLKSGNPGSPPPLSLEPPPLPLELVLLRELLVLRRLD